MQAQSANLLAPHKVCIVQLWIVAEFDLVHGVLCPIAIKSLFASNITALAERFIRSYIPTIDGHNLKDCKTTSKSEYNLKVKPSPVLVLHSASTASVPAHPATGACSNSNVLPGRDRGSLRGFHIPLHL